MEPGRIGRCAALSQSRGAGIESDNIQSGACHGDGVPAHAAAEIKRGAGAPPDHQGDSALDIRMWR
jgi:hypothetical protein